MKNQEIFTYIENKNHRPILEYFSSFSDSFYFFCKKHTRLKLLSKHQIQAIFDDACICMCNKIEAKQITVRQMTSSVKTMIFAIGKNMAFQEGKSEIRYNLLHSFLEDGLNEISDIEDTNKESLLKELQKKHLDKAILNLSQKHYVLVMEGIIEERSNSEIAKEQSYNSANRVSVEKLRVFKILKKAIFEIQNRDEDWEK